MSDYDGGEGGGDYYEGDDDDEEEVDSEEEEDDDEEVGFAKGEPGEAPVGSSEGALLQEEELEEMLISDNRLADEQSITASGGVSNLWKNLKNMRELKGSDRVTSKFLGKYEKARLIAVRAKQIANRAPIKIPISRLRSRDSLKIAKQELEEGVIPNKILRIGTIPGTYEVWELKDFLFIDRD
ncbi:MAG: putative DNA-directed RNA polymerases I, II, and III 23 kDa [Solivirus sp.]|uniref:Putative DNA-directed RNA polymerases I, II, and III 23 kDa n=1 Tax=Solivirus sp. TaxID=2487772 RepID=A0A3G5AFT4_9VIRU|nr:MAG: putative DNA-directed RNA polymerases I, II, and III 23 kDa [Solivirus sp.]